MATTVGGIATALAGYVNGVEKQTGTANYHSISPMHSVPNSLKDSLHS